MERTAFIMALERHSGEWAESLPGVLPSVNPVRRYTTGIWRLIRPIPVTAWSVSVSAASAIGTLRHGQMSLLHLAVVYGILIIGAFLVQGVIAHAVNDLTDAWSGTDAQSPAVLSGGSRVLQLELLDKKELRRIVVWALIFAMTAAGVLSTVSGKWLWLLGLGTVSALAYSLPRLRLSYRPWCGEWLCAFPAVLGIGIAGPWMLLDHMPRWAIVLAAMHALLSIAWLMIHHIPDIAADLAAHPVKQTTVAWFAATYGTKAAKIPVCLYLGLAALVSIFCTLPMSRLAFSGVAVCLVLEGLAVWRLHPGSVVQCTHCERQLVCLTIVCTCWLGCTL